VRKINEKFASASTIIGLSRIVRAKTRLMKISWILMTLVSLALGLYLTSETIKEYLEYDVFTQTKRITASSTLLPAVTFCFHDLKTKDLASYFQKSKMITQDGLVSNLTGNVYDENFIKYLNCIKFNHFINKSDTQLLTANSVFDLLHINIDMRLQFSVVDVFLSDNYKNVLDGSEIATFAQAGTKEVIQLDVRKAVELKLGEPYNSCQNVSDITYRRSNCFAQCKNKNFVAKYNCTFGNYYSIPGYELCKKKISSALEFDTECGELCPEECTTTKFEVVINKWSSNDSHNLEFKIWYLDLSYMEIRQTPKMSGYSLLNEIGGALNLFVGITFMSLLELFNYVFEILFVFFKNKNK
jgi:hypothetical protein